MEPLIWTRCYTKHFRSNYVIYEIVFLFSFLKMWKLRLREIIKFNLKLHSQEIADPILELVLKKLC